MGYEWGNLLILSFTAFPSRGCDLSQPDALGRCGTLDPLPDFGEGKEGITRSVTHHRRAMDDNAQR